MLVKCVCSNCSHSYLADEDGGALTCPRCGVADDTPRSAPDMDDSVRTLVATENR